MARIQRTAGLAGEAVIVTAHEGQCIGDFLDNSRGP